MTSTVRLETTFNNDRDMALACGNGDKRLEEIKKMYEVDISLDKRTLIVTGERAQSAIDTLISPLQAASKASKRGPITPKTDGQENAYKILRANDLSFLEGPAGTGKTQLSIDYAVELFNNHFVSRIILARPAIDAGEKLGFLPGDAKEKVDPYMQPLYDALQRHYTADTLKRLMDDKQIEIAPIAFMRGRTLGNAAIVIDEAQNLTTLQMKMVLTRMGEKSWMAVVGDKDQIDLPRSVPSGLVEAMQTLQNLPKIGMATLTDADCMRSAMVRNILAAYQKNHPHVLHAV